MDILFIQSISLSSRLVINTTFPFPLSFFLSVEWLRVRSLVCLVPTSRAGTPNISPSAPSRTLTRYINYVKHCSILRVESVSGGSIWWLSSSSCFQCLIWPIHCQSYLWQARLEALAATKKQTAAPAVELKKTDSFKPPAAAAPAPAAVAGELSHLHILTLFVFESWSCGIILTSVTFSLSFPCVLQHRPLLLRRLPLLSMPLRCPALSVWRTSRFVFFCTLCDSCLCLLHKGCSLIMI